MMKHLHYALLAGTMISGSLAAFGAQAREADMPAPVLLAQAAPEVLPPGGTGDAPAERPRRGREAAEEGGATGREGRSERPQREAAPERAPREGRPERAPREAAPEPTQQREAAPERPQREAAPERPQREAAPERSQREAAPERSQREAAPERPQREAAPERAPREGRPERAPREERPAPAAREQAPAPRADAPATLDTPTRPEAPAAAPTAPAAREPAAREPAATPRTQEAPAQNRAQELQNRIDEQRREREGRGDTRAQDLQNRIDQRQNGADRPNADAPLRGPDARPIDVPPTGERDRREDRRGERGERQRPGQEFRDGAERQGGGEFRRSDPERRESNDYDRRDRRLDERFGRREERQGDRLVIREGDDRTIITEGGRTIIRHNETERLSRNSRDVRVERRRGEVETIIRRPNGVEIVTINDDDGRLLRRIRRERDREIVLIDNTRRPRGVNVYLDLPPVEVDLPEDEYVVDYGRANPRELEETFRAPPVQRIEREYSLDEVRQNVRLRERVRSVDVNTVQFEFGQWTVPPTQARQLEQLAKAIQAVIDRDPKEVFLIEGHTDAVGSDIDNLSLSDRRAEEVAAILSAEFQIPAENLVTQGYGEQYLKVDTQSASQENRRVTLRRITPLLNAQGK
jgi:outer membrane protein OmpA-like peptidoglycan-associated protein